MELKADNSRMLMSDILKDRVDDANQIEKFVEEAICVVVDRRIDMEKLPLTGILKTVMFDTEPEIEIMVEISEALLTISSGNLEILGIELQHGIKTTVPMPGPFQIKAARIHDVDVINQTCTLALHLQRKKKA
jgi:hypothetical protein